MPTIAILGSGAVGALVGAELTRAGIPTTIVTREPTRQRLQQDGITVHSPRFGDHTVAVDARATLDERADVLLVAVKAPQLAEALERVTAQPNIVVPLLNGVEHMTTLRKAFPEVHAGVVRVQAHRAAPAHVVHRAPFLTITIATPAPPVLADGLRAAGIDVLEGGSEAQVLWGKLSRLAGLALATAAADAPLGDVRADAEAVSREVVAVAAAQGAAVAADTIIAELRGLPDAATSSLRADVMAGARDHELDAIGGAVLRAAARHGLAASRTADLVARVRTRAAGSL